MNVSVEPNLPEKKQINYHWQVFPLSSSFQFPSFFLSDHSDPLKISQLRLNANTGHFTMHLKTATKHPANTVTVAQHTANEAGSQTLRVRYPQAKVMFLRDAAKRRQLTVIP